MSEWKPPEILGLCPVCHDEFYVPHGGKCPADHFDETPDLIEYVRAEEVEAKLHQTEIDLENTASRMGHLESILVGLCNIISRAKEDGYIPATSEENVND